MTANIAREDPRRERTRQALIEGGRRVLARKGVEAATVLEIAREAGVSQPSFYNHFASKNALVEAIAADFFQADIQFKIRIFQQVDDPAEAIAINARHTLQVARQDPAVAWVLVRAGELRNLVRPGAADELVQMIRSGMRRGRFQAVDPRVAAAAIRGAAFPLLQDILLGTAPKNVESQFAELVLRMLGLPAREAAAIAVRPLPAAAEESSAPRNGKPVLKLVPKQVPTKLKLNRRVVR